MTEEQAENVAEKILVFAEKVYRLKVEASNEKNLVVFEARSLPEAYRESSPGGSTPETVKASESQERVVFP